MSPNRKISSHIIDREYPLRRQLMKQQIAAAIMTIVEMMSVANVQTNVIWVSFSRC